MLQIADWLEKLGMSEYTDRFVENHIDESIIRELTDQDLKDLGVVSLGHRRKMLRAIRDLDGAPVAVTLGTRGDRATSAGRRRASPADCDVHRPRRFDRALDEARPRRSAFCD